MLVPYDKGSGSIVLSAIHPTLQFATWNQNCERLRQLLRARVDEPSA